MTISEKRIHSFVFCIFLEQFLLWRANWNLHWRSKMKMEKKKENSDKWKEETVQTYERFLLFIQLTANWFWWNHYILSYIIWKKKVNPVQWFEQCIKSINFNFTTDMTLRIWRYKFTNITICQWFFYTFHAIRVTTVFEKRANIHESYKFVPSLIDKIQKTRDTKALQRAINSYLYLVAATPSLCIVVVQLYYSSVDTKEKKISRLLARCHRSAAQKKLWRMKRRAIPLILQNSFRSQEA